MMTTVIMVVLIKQSHFNLFRWDTMIFYHDFPQIFSPEIWMELSIDLVKHSYKTYFHSIKTIKHYQTLFL